MKENWVYRRGDLYLANLGVPVGSKQGGVRPVVVLQNDAGNYYAPTITIAPLTSKIEKKRKQRDWQNRLWYWQNSSTPATRYA